MLPLDGHLEPLPRDSTGDVSPAETLLETLRKRLQLTGSKESSGAGACGCCAVIADGDAIAACMSMILEMDGKNIVIIEGLEDAKKGLDPIQQAFIDENAFQCGYGTRASSWWRKPYLQRRSSRREMKLRKLWPTTSARCNSHRFAGE